VLPTCWSHRRRRCPSFCRVRWYRWRWWWWWWWRRKPGISHGRDRPQPEPETTSVREWRKGAAWGNMGDGGSRTDTVTRIHHWHWRRNGSERNGRGPRDAWTATCTRANDADRRLSGARQSLLLRSPHDFVHAHRANVARPPEHVSRRRRVHERRRSGYRTCEHNTIPNPKFRNIIIVVFRLFFVLYNTSLVSPPTRRRSVFANRINTPHPGPSRPSEMCTRLMHRPPCYRKNRIINIIIMVVIVIHIYIYTHTHTLRLVHL